MSLTEVFALGVVCWLATTLITETEIFRPLRQWLANHAIDHKKLQEQVKEMAVAAGMNTPGNHELQAPPNWQPPKHFWIDKAAYLVHCPMCTGVWIGFIEAAFFGSPLHHWYGWVAGALLYKAIGHLVLELRPQAWPQRGAATQQPQQQTIQVPKPIPVIPPTP